MAEQNDRLNELGIVSPQLAQAKAIDNLSQPKGKANRTLTVLTNKDLPRFNLIFAIYDLTDYDWVLDVANNEFDMRSSTNRKGKRGRDDVVNVCQPKEENEGVLSSFKENITSFFRSGT